ncbi:hypothetical protein ACG02S_22485 [Roseateles sp. DC23W]|uniref:Solute-binding protein family 3/N-terminal domain-containing protein n=1 Tax=Pelomonas dachongensis TaxID=3299029 RepID=A0ABW7ET61_9BURK
MTTRRRVLAAALALLGTRAAAAPPLVVTLRAPDGATDPRNDFIGGIARLALDRTQASHGDYRLEQSVPMNNLRALRAAGQNSPPNLLLPVAPDVGRAAGLVAVPFPLHLGVHGYRVCFVNPARREQLRAVRQLRDLRPFVHVQGKDWADVTVLRANGLKVVERTSYPAMFQMVALGRVDLFCRSILEAGPELERHADLPGLMLDDSLLLAYDLPSYFHTHPANVALLARMTTGLQRAYADGSLQSLLRQRLQPYEPVLQLARRRVIRLASPPGWPSAGEPRLTPEQLMKSLR